MSEDFMIEGDPDTPAAIWLAGLLDHWKSLNHALEIDDYETIFKDTRAMSDLLRYIEDGCLQFLIAMKPTGDESVEGKKS